MIQNTTGVCLQLKFDALTYVCTFATIFQMVPIISNNYFTDLKISNQMMSFYGMLTIRYYQVHLYILLGNIMRLWCLCAEWLITANANIWRGIQFLCGSVEKIVQSWLDLREAKLIYGRFVIMMVFEYRFDHFGFTNKGFVSSNIESVSKPR